MTPLVFGEIRPETSAHDLVTQHKEQLFDEGRALAIRDSIIQRLSLSGICHSAADRVCRRKTISGQAPELVFQK